MIKTDDDKEKLRASLELTREELNEPGEGCSLYLVVGVALLPSKLKNLEVDLSKTVSTKKHAVGMERPESGKIVTIDSEREATLVVTSFGKEQVKVTLGALLNEEEGLSIPYTIAAQDVFYFHEYRDDAGAWAARQANWTRKINMHCVRTADQISDPVRRQRQASSDHTAQYISELKTVMRSGLLLCLTTPKESRSIDWLDNLKVSHERARSDSNGERVLEADALSDFMLNSDEFGECQADKMVQVLALLWPELEGVTAERLRKLHKGLVEAEIVLEYRLLRAFVAGGVYQLSQQGVDNAEQDNLGVIVRSVHGLVTQILGPKKVITAVPTEETMLLS